MTNKSAAPHAAKKPAEGGHHGMMGDGTEEQDLDQLGNETARIKEEDVGAAFDKQSPTPKTSGS